jgi:hypothetical protein
MTLRIQFWIQFWKLRRGPVFNAESGVRFFHRTKTTPMRLPTAAWILVLVLSAIFLISGVVILQNSALRSNRNEVTGMLRRAYSMGYNRGRLAERASDSYGIPIPVQVQWISDSLGFEAALRCDTDPFSDPR